MRAAMTLVLVAGAMAAGTASPARAAEVLEKTSFKGENAFVAFTGSAAITCPDASSGTLDSTVFLSGFEFVSKSRQSGGSSANTVFAQLIQFNSCTGNFLTATGLVNGAFSGQGLRSATMTAAIPLSGFEGPVGTLLVDVQLTASGKLVKTRSRSRTEFETPEGDLVVTFSRSMGKTREATASGTLIFNGTTLVGTLQDAFIDDSKNGEMIVLH